MKLEHSFTVPVPTAEAWLVLLDIRRVVPCMPGATIETVDGDDFTGTVKVKVGPIIVTYSGSARFTEKDQAAGRAIIVAKGKETRGAGTARATVTGTLRDAPEGTRVDVVTDLAITGKPAQFGRGVMADVGSKLIGQFADCLAAEVGEGHGTAAAPEPAVAAPAPLAAAARAAAAPAPVPLAPRHTPEAIDLVGTAGAPVAKRLGPLLAVLVALLALLAACRRRRR
jgi:uncharacterized protein